MRSRTLALLLMVVMLLMPGSAMPQGRFVDRYTATIWDASVMVVALKGYGTGTYVDYKGTPMIITSNHIVEGEVLVYVAVRGSDPAACLLAYSDPVNDLAVLIPVEGVQGATPLKYRPADPQIGESTLYSGYPNYNGKMIISGIVSGTIEDLYLLHSFAWMGSSGSGVFDADGHMLGVIKAIDVADTGIGFSFPIEDVVVMVPVNTLLDLDVVLDKLDQ